MEVVLGVQLLPIRFFEISFMCTRIFKDLIDSGTLHILTLDLETPYADANA